MRIGKLLGDLFILACAGAAMHFFGWHHKRPDDLLDTALLGVSLGAAVLILAYLLLKQNRIPDQFKILAREFGGWFALGYSIFVVVLYGLWGLLTVKIFTQDPFRANPVNEMVLCMIVFGVLGALNAYVKDQQHSGY
jgi:hypothetical protein